MSIQSKSTQLIIRLLRLTAEDKIVWKVKDPPRSIVYGTDDFVPLYFEGKYKDKYIALFSRRFQTFYPDLDNFLWNEQIVFAVLDEDDRVLWEIDKNIPALITLMETVREKSSGINDLLEDMLSTDD